MVVGSVVKPSFYRDSLSLLRLCRDLKDRVDVDEVAALMGTPANKQLYFRAEGADAEAAVAALVTLVNNDFLGGPE